jgi:hypothetical protein
MDKHTRPFTCMNPICNGANFGDRAGLQRHEREKHQEAKHFCQVSTCPRHRRGFARKNHLELHVAALHRSGASISESPLSSAMSGKMDTIEEDQTEKEKSDEIGGEIRGLKTKLTELEARRKLLVASQVKVEEDIQAVERTLQLYICGSN